MIAVIIAVTDVVVVEAVVIGVIRMGTVPRGMMMVVVVVMGGTIVMLIADGVRVEITVGVPFMGVIIMRVGRNVLAVREEGSSTIREEPVIQL